MLIRRWFQVPKCEYFGAWKPKKDDSKSFDTILLLSISMVDDNLVILSTASENIIFAWNLKDEWVKSFAKISS